MNCIHCQSIKTKKAGKNSARTQRYICHDCGKCFTGNPTGRPSKGDQPMTDAERAKRYRVRKKSHPDT